MRLFFGLPIPGDLRDRLAQLQEDFKETLPVKTFRWTRPELFHVTLAFLGEVPEARVPDLCRRAALICERFSPSALSFTRFGCFPSERAPRVLWTGCDETDPAAQDISRLGAELSTECGGFGDGQPESKVILHVTLARSNRTARKSAAETVQRLFASRTPLTLPEAPIHEAILYQSTLADGPTRYEPLGRFPLKA